MHNLNLLKKYQKNPTWKGMLQIHDKHLPSVSHERQGKAETHILEDTKMIASHNVGSWVEF
jgi:hypothetical protein